MKRVNVERRTADTKKKSFPKSLHRVQSRQSLTTVSKSIKFTVEWEIMGYIAYGIFYRL